MNIPLDRTKPVPVARQIRDHLERLIRDRRLASGVKLPASRELAQTLGVNRATVTSAYDELVSEGWARARVGQGTFVAERAVGEAPSPQATAAPSSPLNWSALLSRSAHIVRADDQRRRSLVPSAGSDSSSIISFAGGMPDSALFPTEAFRRTLNAVIREDGESLLQYSPAAGYSPLREYLSAYLLRVGVEARPDEILIVNGSQQGFDLIARTFLDPDDPVAIEQPTYPRAMQVFRSFGGRLLPVAWDDAGPRIDLLDRLLERHAAKLFYCQPSAHNPTGQTIRPERARSLLAVAARHQVPIVEDGFDGSLHYGRHPARPLKASDTDRLVIYIGTFSKILFPGLRLGWIVAPPPVIERLQAAKQLADLHTSALIQAAVHRFCEQRLLDRHVARVAGEYTRRRTLLLDALRQRMPPDATWTEPDGGFSLLLTLPEGLHAAEILPHAMERGVAFTPGVTFYADGGGERTLRLSFSSVRVARIDEGVRRLAETIKAMRHRGPMRAPVEGAIPVV